MRNFVLFVAMMLIATRIGVAEPVAAWQLPEAELQKSLARVRGLVTQRGWTVTGHGNEIVIRRDQPTAMKMYLPNGPALSAGEEHPAEPAGESSLELVLRFRPTMSTDEYERLAAVNVESDRRQDELRREVGVGYKFESFAPTTPAERARVVEYRQAIAKLPRHVLPDFYTPEYSILYLHRWHGWASPADATVQAEWMRIEEQLIRSFGMHDPLAVANRTTVGQYADKDEATTVEAVE